MICRHGSPNDKCRICDLEKGIESQKEEIEKLKSWVYKLQDAHQIEQFNLNAEIESLKAITELAVKGLQNSIDDISILISEYPNELWTYSEQQRWADIGNDGITAINNTLSEIERLSK